MRLHSLEPAVRRRQARSAAPESLAKATTVVSGAETWRRQLRKTIVWRRRSCMLFAPRTEDRDATRKVDIRDQGDRVIASRRLKARAPIPETELRKAVNTELVALFNTTNLEFDRRLVDSARGAKIHHQLWLSRSLTRRTIDENETNGIAREIETALRDFEPRLLAGSIKARRDDTVSPDELRVRFLVSAGAEDAAGRGSGAIHRRGGARLRQDQARPALER